jgi:predicted transcriptional regulator
MTTATIQPNLTSNKITRQIANAISEARDDAHCHIRHGRFDSALQVVSDLNLILTRRIQGYKEIRDAKLILYADRAYSNVQQEIRAALESRGYNGN